MSPTTAPTAVTGGSSWLTLIIPLIFMVAPLLALIPGFLAKNKGYSFPAFYVPAIFVFLPMLIAAIVVRKKPGYVRAVNTQYPNTQGLQPPVNYKYSERPISNEEKMERLAVLLEQGFITTEEYETQKRKLETSN